jgi:hypothetical protein
LLVNLSLFRFPHFGLLPVVVTALALLSATDVPFVLKAPGRKTTPRYQLKLPVHLMLILATDVPLVSSPPGRRQRRRCQLKLPVNLSLFRFPHFGLLPATALALLSAMDVPFVLKAPCKTTMPRYQLYLPVNLSLLFHFIPGKTTQRYQLILRVTLCLLCFPRPCIVTPTCLLAAPLSPASHKSIFLLTTLSALHKVPPPV